MKKLGLLLFLFVCAAVVRAQSNIVKSLERNVPGQGKVTIHQDSRIEALLGWAHCRHWRADCYKSSGYRVQAYAGNNTRQLWKSAPSGRYPCQGVLSRTFGLYFFQSSPVVIAESVFFGIEKLMS